MTGIQNLLAGPSNTITKMCPSEVIYVHHFTVLSDPQLVECDCDWQVHVNGDCTEALICHSA